MNCDPIYDFSRYLQGRGREEEDNSPESQKRSAGIHSNGVPNITSHRHRNLRAFDRILVRGRGLQ